jgi:hypothetical protein
MTTLSDAFQRAPVTDRNRALAERVVKRMLLAHRRNARKAGAHADKRRQVKHKGRVDG